MAKKYEREAKSMLSKGLMYGLGLSFGSGIAKLAVEAIRKIDWEHAIRDGIDGVKNAKNYIIVDSDNTSDEE